MTSEHSAQPSSRLSRPDLVGPFVPASQPGGGEEVLPVLDRHRLVLRFFLHQVHLEGGVTQTQEIGGGYGHYGAQDDMVLHFGLGDECGAEV